MKRQIPILLLGLLVANFSWAQTSIFDNSGAGDNLYSNTENWTAGLPGAGAGFAQFNATASLDIETTVRQIRGSASVQLSNGGGTITVIGLSPAAVLQAAGESFTMDANMILDSGDPATFKTFQVNTPGGILTFGSNSDVTLNSIARLVAVSPQQINMNGVLRGANALQINSNANVVFGATSDNSNFASSIVYFGNGASVTANTIDDNVFIPSGRKIQVNADNGVLTLNGANIYQGGLTVGGANNFRMEVNEDQGAVGSLILGTGTLTLALGANVGLLAFSNNATSTWEGGASNLTIENFKNGVIRFGTDATGLTAAQLDQIDVGVGSIAYLDANGYLNAANSIWDGTWSSLPSAADDAVIMTNYNAGSLEVNDLNIQSGATVTIAAGETLQVNGNLTNAGTLNIASGGSLITMGEVVGDATVSRNTAGLDGYSIIGAPVRGTSLASIISQGATQLFDFDGTDYVAVSTGEMLPGKGYFMAQVDVVSPAVTFTGSIVSGDVTANVSGAGDGFTILANPYAGAISAAAVIASDATTNVTTGSIYIWEDGGSNDGALRVGSYRVANAIVSDFSNIGAVQGFYVQSNTGGDITFAPAMQDATAGANSDANYYRTIGQEKQILKLAISGNQLYQETIVAFVEGATLGRDYSLDAQYLQGNDLISFYSTMENVKFATQGLPLVQEESLQVDLGMDLAEAGTYTLSVESFSGFSNDQNVTLVDNLTGDLYPLDADFSITFSTETVKEANRFSIIMAPAAVLSTSGLEGLEVLTMKNSIDINATSGQALKGDISIMDIQGRQLLYKRFSEKQTTVSLPFDFDSKTIYIIRMNLNGNVSTKKIIFN